MLADLGVPATLPRGKNVQRIDDDKDSRKPASQEAEVLLSRPRLLDAKREHDPYRERRHDNAIIVAFIPVVFAPKSWIPFFHPPGIKNKPTTTRILPVIDPAIEALTSSTSPHEGR